MTYIPIQPISLNRVLDALISERSHRMKRMIGSVLLLMLTWTVAGLAQGQAASDLSTKNCNTSLLLPNRDGKLSKEVVQNGICTGARRSHTNLKTPKLQDPLFVAPLTFEAGGASPLSVAIADVIGDGKPDLVVANRYSGADEAYVAVLLGNGDGTFQSAVSYPSGGKQASSVAVVDLNHDGKLDIVVSHESSPVIGVLLGHGDGTFEPRVAYASGSTDSYSMAVGDLNEDGKLDVVAIAMNGPSVSILLGNGDGTLQPPVLLSAGVVGRSITVADVNGDGKADLIIGGYPSYQSTGAIVGVLLGNGDGTFQAPLTFMIDASAGWVSSVAVGDLNQDGKADIVAVDYATSSSKLAVLLGNGDGNFAPAVTYDPGAGYAWNAVITDVNGDGKPDVAVDDWYGTVSVFMGKGDGTLSAAVTFDVPIGAVSIQAADVNGDGRPDVVVPDSSASVNVLLNNTGPHEATKTTITSSLNPAVFGQMVTMTATVTSAKGVPEGTVQFTIDSNPVVKEILNNGQASAIFGFTVGSYQVSTAYQGSLKYGVSESDPLHQVVNKATDTVWVLSHGQTHPGKRVTYTATVSPEYSGSVTGSVAFYDGPTLMTTQPLVENSAKYKTSYAEKGTHTITAKYLGDDENEPVVSNPFVEKIVGYASKTVVTSSGSPSQVGQPVTLTATVTSTYGKIPDDAMVTFFDGKTTLGSAPLVSGVAAYTTTFQTAKRHMIKAVYPGDKILDGSQGHVYQVVTR